MPRKREAPVETVFDVMESQEELLDKLSSKRMEISVGGELAEEEWMEIRRGIGEAAKGFLSEDTVELINVIDQFGLYAYPRYLLKLEQKLRRDFNELRRIYVQKGWIHLPQVRDVTSLEAPVDWEALRGSGRGHAPRPPKGRR